MGGYRYTGVYYSSSYDMSLESGVETCKKRKAFDEAAIKKEYEENLMMIDSLIDIIISEPRCMGIKEIVLEYRNRLRKHQEEYDSKVKLDTGYLVKYFPNADVQRQFAYVASYSSTCNGGHHRETSFIDLDMLNKLPANTAAPVQVSQDGQMVDKCGDVQAIGGGNLKGFEISLKNAKGSNFLFSFDPYEIPDQLILSDNIGNTLFDSGCTASKPSNLNVSIPLSKVSESRKVKISIVNSCLNPVADGKTGGSGWEFRLKCEEEVTEGPCFEEKLMLVKLVQKKIEHAKVLMDAIAHHKQCFTFFDEDVLKELEKSGILLKEDSPKVNEICEIQNVECREWRKDEKK